MTNEVPDEGQRKAALAIACLLTLLACICAWGALSPASLKRAMPALAVLAWIWSSAYFRRHTRLSLERQGKVIGDLRHDLATTRDHVARLREEISARKRAEVDLAIFLERLWIRDPPDRLDLWRMVGSQRNARAYSESFAAGASPSAERCTWLAKQILAAAQCDSDSAERTCFYELAVVDRQGADNLRRRLGPFTPESLLAVPPRAEPSPAASRLTISEALDLHEAASESIAADCSRVLAASLRECAETLRDRVAMADNGDSVLAKCALDCERASEIMGAALIFPKGPDA